MPPHNINNQKPAVLQLLPALISGGVERGATEINTALVQTGFRSFVASAGGPMISSIYHTGGKHIQLPLASKNPFVMWRNSMALVDIIKDLDIKVVHARSRAPAWSGYIAAKLTGCKFITTFHGIYKINNSLKKSYNSIMTKGQRVIAVSNFTSDHIIQNYQIDPAKLSVIHRGVDMDYFNPDKVGQERIIQMVARLHIPMDRPIILMPGRLTRWKGQKFLLDSLRLLVPGSFYCLIVGNDTGHLGYRKELEKLVSDYNMSQDVGIVGNITDMPALYMLADVVVSASIQPEAFGRVVTEAQAMGKQVVATNIGGACETVIEGKTGWLVAPHDKEAMSLALKQALAVDSNSRKDSAIFLRNYAEQNFSMNMMCSKTIKLYREILGIDE